MENTPPTLEEIELNKRICVLPIIRELQATDKEIIDDLEQIKEGQDKINDKVDLGFSKGKDRMDGLESMFKDHISTTKDNHKETMSAYSDLKTEIRDQKITELKNELKDRKSNDNGLKNDLIKIALVTIISAVGYLFIKSYG